MPKDLKHKTLRLKRGDIRVRTRGELTAVVWKDKRDVGMLTNIHDPPSEGNFRDEHGNAITLFPPVRHDHSQQLILLSACGGKKISHRDFRLTLVREMLAWAGHEPRPSKAVGRLALASANISRLDTCHNKHWPGCNPTKRRCRVCSE